MKEPNMTASFPKIRCNPGERAIADAARRHTKESISNFCRNAIRARAGAVLKKSGQELDDAIVKLLAEAEAEAP